MLNFALIVCIASILFLLPARKVYANPILCDEDLTALSIKAHAAQTQNNLPDLNPSEPDATNPDAAEDDSTEDSIPDDSTTDDRPEETFPDYTDKQGVIYECDKNLTCRVKGYAKDIKESVTIPQQISIGDDSFTVTGILDAAFKKCSALKNIEIPDKLEAVSKKAFRNCKNLSDIYVIPSKSTVKKDGKSMLTIIRVSNPLLQETAKAKIKIEKSMVERAAENRATDTVTLKVIVTASSVGDTKIVMPGSLALSESAAKTLASSNKTLQIRIYGSEDESYFMEITAANMQKADGTLDFSLQEKSAADIPGTFSADFRKALKKNSLSADDVKIFTFSFGDGVTPVTDVSFYADDMPGVDAGSPMYVYKYNKNQSLFQVVTYYPQAVSKRGNITVPVSKGGVFLITKKPFSFMVKKLSNSFITESGKTYYLDQNSSIVYGWRQIGNDYYYFNRESGKMHAGCQVDGIFLKENGAAVKTAAYVQQIQTMIKARLLVEQVTSPSDSMSQKIEKCFRWIFQFPYHQYRRLQPIYKQAGWEVTFANDIFDHRQGCCVSEASALAFMFHECGYKTVYVACDTGHAWVELDGRVYDPLFAEARGFDRYYNVSYSSYGLYAVLKRQI